MTRLWIGRSEDDPDIVATWGLFDLDEAGLDAMRDDPEWMAAENRRMERMARFEREFVISGYFHVAEEVSRRLHARRASRPQIADEWRRVAPDAVGLALLEVDADGARADRRERGPRGQLALVGLTDDFCAPCWSVRRIPTHGRLTPCGN